LTVNLVITTLIILGGIGYIVMSDLYRSRFTRRLSLHSKVVLITTIGLIVFGTALIFVLEYKNPETLGPLSLKGKILTSYFQAVTARTAGFNTLDISMFTSPVLLLIIVLMFIGASPSGTGGGIKTTTFATMLAALRSFFESKKDVHLMKRTISQDTVMKSFILTALALLFVFFITFLLLISEQTNFLRTLFEVVSAFATCGLTAAVGTQLSLSSFFSSFGKLLIILTMFVGRLGPLTVTAAILEEGSSTKYKYAEDKVIIG
jgi:trk system potassium uptake protein TrkH